MMKIWNRLRIKWQVSRKMKRELDHANGVEHARILLRAGCCVSYVLRHAETTGSTSFGEGMKEAVREWEAAQVGIYSVTKGRVE